MTYWVGALMPLKFNTKNLKSIIEEDFEHYYQIKPYPVFKPILQELKKLLP